MVDYARRLGIFEGFDPTYFGQPYLENYSNEKFQIFTRSVFESQLHAGAQRGMHSVTFQILHMGPWSEGGPPDFSELRLIAHLSYVLFGK